MFLSSSCETPQGGNSAYLPLYKGKNGSRFVSKRNRDRRAKRREEQSFEERFQADVLDNGLAQTLNNAVTPSYAGADCFKVASSYTVSELEDSKEIDQMIEKAFNADASCKKVFTGNKGNTTGAGLPYAKTFAYSMIQDLCNPEVANIGKNLSSPSFGSKDALSLSLFNKGSVSGTDPKNLATTYSLMYSLGQREADGNFKEGRDLSGNNKSAETVEAGLFQVSANSLNLGSGKTKGFLKDIFRSFVGRLSTQSSSEKASLCLNAKLRGTKETRSPASSDDLQSLFSSGSCKGSASIVKASSYRSSRVATCFRKLTKACPSFAIKYAAGVARVNRAHNGPLVTHSELRRRGLKSAKYHKPYLKPACHSVFKSIASNKSMICGAK